MSQPPIHLDSAISAAPSTLQRRVWTAVVCVAAFSLLCVGAWLTPSASGVGTHEQLGLPPCGWYERTGVPCITCGMTTAVTLAAHGHLWDAMRVQPAGAVLALVAAVTVLITGYAAARDLDLSSLTHALFRGRTLALILVLVIGAWVYKIIITTTGA